MSATANVTKVDFYEVLQVTREANDQELKASYRKLAMQFHPDRNPNNPEAEEKFKECSEAYAVLSDPEKRAAYDRYGHAAFQGGLLKRAVPLVQEQKIRVGIVRHKEIDLAVLIEIVKHGREAMRDSSLAQAGPVGDIGESAVAVIVIQHAMASLQADGAAKAADIPVRTNRRGFVE